jgi:hypothetical protein
MERLHWIILTETKKGLRINETHEVPIRNDHTNTYIIGKSQYPKEVIEKFQKKYQRVGYNLFDIDLFEAIYSLEDIIKKVKKRTND